MIGLDTNIVLRYILQDDWAQSRVATRFVEDKLTKQTPGFLSLAVVLETVWVLRSAFRWSEFAIMDVVETLLSVDVFLVQNEKAVYRAVSAVKREGAEFEDALIAALGMWAGCVETVTFDRKAARLPGVRRLA